MDAIAIFLYVAAGAGLAVKVARRGDATPLGIWLR